MTDESRAEDEQPEDGAAYLVKLAKGVVYMAIVGYVSYAVVRYADQIELRAKIVVTESRRRLDALREWRRAQAHRRFEIWTLERDLAREGDEHGSG